MNENEFQEIFSDQIKYCEKMLFKKGLEYAVETDRLHNFKIAAMLQNETELQALGGMMAKHIVSIYDMIDSNEPYTMSMWDEKLGDAINYLILAKAILIENKVKYLKDKN